MKMQYVLQEIPEKFSAKGGYNGRFINQKQLDAKAVIEEAIAMDFVPAYSPSQVKACALGLLESMLAGVARDGNPRCVDGFFKVSPVLKGRFEKVDSSFDPKVNSVVVNVQLLHELKPIDTANWSFVNATPEPEPGPTPTGPNITGLNSDGQAEGVVKLNGANLNIRGTGFADGGVVTIKDSNDDNMVMALEASWDPVTQQLQLYIDTEATPAAGPGTVIVATSEGEATHACTFAS